MSTSLETVVVDASVIVSVLIDPSSAVNDLAERLSTAHLIAPALMPFEVSNVLRRRRNSGLLTPRAADDAHGLLRILPIDLWPWEAVAAQVWGMGHNLSSYDAAYVAVAQAAGISLLTRDARLARAPGVGVHIDVV